jgi:peptidoglycan/LPS O-acetylase OafA/YrhL
MPVSQSAPKFSSWQRVDGIDLLRGISILFVLMNHVNIRLLGADVPYTHGMPPQLAATIAWSGQQAVQIFFAISGYLITSTSIRRWGPPSTLSIQEFYQLRVARIAPLMFLLLGVLCALHFAGVHGDIVSYKTGGLPRALLAALTFHINYLEATRGYLPGNWDILWSLSVEEMFYLFFPLLARLFRRTRYLIPLLALFIVAGPFARMKAFNPNPVWREYSYLGGMDAIAFGCLTAILLSGKRLGRTAVLTCGSAGSALLTFCLAFSLQAYKLGLGRNGLYFTLIAVAVCLIVTAATQSQWRSLRILAPLLVIGRHSYEIYLTHMFGVLLLFALFIRAGKPLSAVLPLFLGAILVAALLGWAVAALYSEPMNRWIRKRFVAAS